MSVERIDSIAGLRERLSEFRRRGQSIGLVPTMGALHAGHSRLIEQARRETACVVVSIFVNPIQFNKQEDYNRYPQTLATDLATCARLGVNVVFAPRVEEMYPQPQRTFVDVEELTDHLCGKFRPGHFRGVATVVAKLFNIVQPDMAYFGEKDAQQLATIERMAADLNLPLRIVAVPTVREDDGLALSSRNQLLSPEERQTASALYQALKQAQEAVSRGERQTARILEEALQVLEQTPGVRVEYLDIVDPKSMQPIESIHGRALIAGAIWVGTTRLIDNLLLVDESE